MQGKQVKDQQRVQWGAVQSTKRGMGERWEDQRRRSASKRDCSNIQREPTLTNPLPRTPLSPSLSLTDRSLPRWAISK